ncbi:hypothetical protein EDC04DRAFT_2907000 [Pisolithus marmoratus]|nr:hypothetical protein EDC04DRAFT_2907000 [Pisolithus marmoratus]
MNQPSGSCYHASLAEDLIYGEDIEVQSATHSQGDNENVDMDTFPDYGDPLNFDNPHRSQHDPDPGIYVETYEGCTEAFPGGETFMDRFRCDQYAEQCRENSYFLWASRQEWAFALWLLRSRLSMAAIDCLLLLEIMRNLSLSFRSAEELRTCAEILPSGPQWSLLSHPLFKPHISFVPRKVWTSAAKTCHMYDEWLSGDCAWSIQEALPPGATLLGVVLSSDKTNILVMSGNCMAHPLLISPANIDACLCSKSSAHAYLLLALLPIAKFTHKTTHICSLLQDRLVHQALNVVLSPLKTATSVGVMMSDPKGNLCYCFTPLAAWIADTPEEGLLAGTAMKVSPVTTATSKEFGDPYQHPPCTAATTLTAICSACSQYSLTDYKNFLKAMRWFQLNGVIEPCWNSWPLSDPSIFLTPEVLHHFHQMFWDHDVKWCIDVTGATELDFHFSIIQTLVGYWAFSEGISRLKQVTGRDHCAVQCYIIATVAGSVPCKFLTAIHTLLDFHYLAQALSFTTRSLEKVASSLQEFHNHKEAIMSEGIRVDWQIPKLELLQSVVLSIQQSGAVMQWLADITEHAHVKEIKVPARAGNNQNYNNQIVCHLNRLDKTDDENPSNSDVEEEYEADGEGYLSTYSTLTHQIPNYFSISASLLLGKVPSAPKPYCTFATPMTGFHLSTKPSFWLTVDEASITYQLPNLEHALATFFANGDTSFQVSQHAITKLQIWCKLHVQQLSYHNKTLLSPQMLRAILPSMAHPHGQYDSIITSIHPKSDWPGDGLAGHSISQLCLIFCLTCSDLFLMGLYIPGVNPTSASGSSEKEEVGYWPGAPQLDTKPTAHEGLLMSFFNLVIAIVNQACAMATIRVWSADSAMHPLSGGNVMRKPDLSCWLNAGSKFDWRHLATFAKVKNCMGKDNKKSSYIEMAGKASCLMYAQDSHHAAPCLCILGSQIYLTVFDWGGSLSTCGYDIHHYPCKFLCILISVTSAPRNILGFNISINWGKRSCPDGKVVDVKELKIEMDATTCTIELTRVLFISDNLFSQGTMVWEGMMKARGTSGMQARKVAVKDSWIDPLRKYTEGKILSILNMCKIKGIPMLVHKEQVKAPYLSVVDCLWVNGSIHFPRAYLAHYKTNSYYLHVLSRIITHPVGNLITEFSCLGGLLVAFLDYIVGEQDYHS